MLTAGRDGGGVSVSPFVFVSSARLRSEKWMNVQVGDIIKLENNQFVTVGLKVETGYR